MRRHITKLESLQDSWKEKAELALSKDREDLATAALVEKQKAGDMAERLKSEISVLDDALKGYENDIAKLQKKLSEARARQSNVSTRLESAENRYKLREMTNGDRVEDAFSRFEILERRADALGLGYKKSLDEEIAELQAADKVADELAALKAAQASKN
jgi:phage shock protein A